MSDSYKIKWLSALLAILFLALPISSTVKSLLLPFALLTVLLISEYRLCLKDIFSSPWCLAGVSLFLLAILASFWSPSNLKDKAYVIEKYSKLIYLPILVVGFQEAKTRWLAMHAFLLAMVITCVLSLLKSYGLFQSFDFTPEFVFRNHIMTGIMVSFSAYLCATLAYRTRGYARIIYIILALCFSYHVLWINHSHTGYIMYGLLMGGMVFVRYRALRPVMILVPLVLGLFWGNATKQSLQKAEFYHKSIDLRIQFHQFARKLFENHAVLGNGTASFSHYFQKEQPVPEWDRRLWEPHSQYWFIATEFGLLGLMTFLLFLFYLFKTSLQLDQTKGISIALLTIFAVGNLSDSLLFYSGSGYFFILFMALCLGETLQREKTVNTPQTLVTIRCF